MQIVGKVALVTGAARGIGLAIARSLLSNGAKGVALLDILEDAGQRACSDLQAEFSLDKVIFIKVDVTKKEELRAAFEQTATNFGGLDIVCNNAGILDESQWRMEIEVLLVAVIEGTFLAMDYMSSKKGGKGGVVINMASILGIQPITGFEAYGAAKHGVVGFTRSLKPKAKSDNVRVNCICPGCVDTQMGRKGITSFDDDRLSALFSIFSPERVAEGVLQLITDDTKSGAVLLVTKDVMEYPKLPQFDTPDDY